MTSPLLISSHLPKWTLRYKYIESGYRNPDVHTTVYDCIQSLTVFHNETLNIFTHLFATLYYIGALITLEAPPHASIEAKVILYLSCSFPLFMFLFSTIAHIFYPISPRMNTFLWKLDVTGITFTFYTILLSGGWSAGGFQPSIPFYTFQSFCLSWISYSMYSLWVHSNYRSSDIIGSLTSTVFPLVVHVVYPAPPVIQFYLNSGCLMAAISCGVYFLSIPERFVKGRLDFIGNSHHILHIGSFFAALLLLHGTIEVAKHDQYLRLTV